MYTEDEAKTKWCPFARVLSHTYAQDGKGRSYEGGYAYNRSVNPGELYMPPASMCIGSACMAWRWMTWEEDGTVFRMTGPGSAKGRRDGVHEGFCGLAGRP